MKIAIRKEPNGSIYIDKNLREGVNYTHSPYNFNIIEIEDNFSDVESNDFNEDLTFNNDKYNSRKNKELANKELIELKNWFDIEYMRLEQKFRRLHTLGKEYKGISAYDALIQLYNQAESVRARINELEALIDN